ncbi:uncharacterized protein RJT21DRAFT_122447 [Scheffersomyces amazonensis]|uniref:uncharacterized protein n=1 Tax=Scheffersomyces amazonensis TaxID=1078765 RepID=UPI00315CDE74
MAVKNLVLVTGGTGYVATFTLYQLLQRGYNVRTSVRNIGRSEELNKDLLGLNSYEHVKGYGDENKTFEKLTSEMLNKKLTYFAADLNKSAGWKEAIEGVEYILHIASPISTGPSTDEEMVTPAVEGTKRILDLALEYNVKRVVVLSSCAAVTYNELPSGSLLDESVFSSEKVLPNSYSRSKLYQEKAVWEWIKSDKNTKSSKPVEVTVLAPPGIYGPNVPGKLSQSATAVVKNLIDGKMKIGAPKLYFGAVDVRDVAYLSYRGMSEPIAKNQRYIIDATDKPDLSILQFAEMIRSYYSIPENNKDGKVDITKLPTRELPSWFVRVVSYIITPLSAIVPYLDITKHTTNAKAVKAFNWKPITIQECVVATIDTM